jgi:hypothetical protein
VQFLLDGGQRRRHNGLVHGGHEQGDGDDGEDELAAVKGLCPERCDPASLGNLSSSAHVS